MNNATVHNAVLIGLSVAAVIAAVAYAVMRHMDKLPGNKYTPWIIYPAGVAAASSLISELIGIWK